MPKQREAIRIKKLISSKHNPVTFLHTFITNVAVEMLALRLRRRKANLAEGYPSYSSLMLRYTSDQATTISFNILSRSLIILLLVVGSTGN